MDEPQRITLGCDDTLVTDAVRGRYRRLLEQSGYDPDYVMPVFPDATTENSEWWQRHGHDHAPNLLWRIVLAISALYFLIRWVATGERPTP